LFRDLLTALGCAAAAATKLLPSPPQGMLTMADNERREWLERQHPGFQDATAFEVFEEAAAMLFQAFKPEGFTAVTDETSLRLCYQLASLALGQMGARGIDAFTRLAPLDQDLMARWGGREAERISAAAEDQDDKP
jgi:hypothetical protein